MWGRSSAQEKKSLKKTPGAPPAPSAVVMVPWPAPVLEPPITMLPGGDPGINAKSGEIGTAGNAPNLICPRLNPAGATFRTAGEEKGGFLGPQKHGSRGGGVE